MATRDEILKKIEARLIQVRHKELVWGDVVATIGGASASDKTAILTSIKNKNSDELALIIFNLLSAKIAADATAEANAIMSDDSLSLTELQRVF